MVIELRVLRIVSFGFVESSIAEVVLTFDLVLVVDWDGALGGVSLMSITKLESFVIGSAAVKNIAG